MYRSCLTVCRDPNLWTVKCRIGTEKETVMLMRKYIALMHMDTVRIQYMPFISALIYTQLAYTLQLPTCNHLVGMAVLLEYF